MIQFCSEEAEHLKEKGRREPWAVERLKQEVSQVMEEPILVPKTGIGNWVLYYYCPKCSVKLEFDRNDSHHHRCPCCGEILSGEPYDSTWWGIINSRNYTAVYQMGLIYLVTEESGYARKAIDIMMEYSRYYKDYEVHGDIPYNGPGKSGAQTLDEAAFLRTFAIAYDLLYDAMTQSEQEAIRDGMLIPGAEFLMEHRHNQIHNHEVIINSAIAVIGLIFGVERYVQFAVYEPYGLIYQLEHGMLENHMWFEGAFGYHFYALTSFFAYEKFALHTPHSHIHHPNYRAMMELIVSYVEPGFKIPLLNDTNRDHNPSRFYIYEFAYRELGGDKLLYVLNQAYRQEKRDNMEAFFYGVDELPECSIDTENYHIEEGRCGHTVLRGEDDRYLLFKHDSYGGEHDHYDRLGISYQAYGKWIAPDLGTTGYGAVMHYDYYKNTGSHNTVNIGEENQAPVNGVLKRYKERADVVYVEASADWNQPFEMPDSFTIVQWKEENYQKVRMVRKIAWAGKYFAEIFIVNGADQELPIDWVMHFSGDMIEAPEGDLMGPFSDKKPYKYLHSIKKAITGIKDSQKSVLTVYKDGEVTTHVFGMGCGQTVFCGKGPDNPSSGEINYRIERNYGGDAVFAHVISSSDGEPYVKQVEFEKSDGILTVIVTETEGGRREFVFSLKNDGN